MAATEANVWKSPKSFLWPYSFQSLVPHSQLGSSTPITWKHCDSINWFRNKLIFSSNLPGSLILFAASQTPPNSDAKLAPLILPPAASYSSHCPSPVTFCPLYSTFTVFLFHLHHCLSSSEPHASSSEDEKGFLTHLLLPDSIPIHCIVHL